MLIFIFIVLLVLIMLAAIILQKCYTHIPTSELKRRARAGDEFANLLYKAAAYGSSLRALLWIIIGLSGAGFFVLVTRTVPAWAALIFSVLVLWAGFAWLPNTGTGAVAKMTARFLTTPITWLLNYTYPVLSRITGWLGPYTRIHLHTGIYQKEDLVDLLKRQKRQPDNRISENELRIVEGALNFGGKLVRDVMTPRRVIKQVSVTDSIGAHLLDELHKSGHSRFPVYQDKPDNIVGILYIRDLLNHSGGGSVRNFMKKKVLYVHDEQNLNDVLQAFLKTKHHLFIVVNSFEEVVGVISIEDILEQILGKPILDEFDKYDDLRQVAALKAKSEHQNQVPEQTTKKQ